MIGYNEHRFSPDHVNIRCEKCHQKADFYRRKIARISHKINIPFFESSPYFDYVKGETWEGRTEHLAAFYPHLIVKDLPDDDFHWYSKGFAGSVICRHCELKKKINLDWLNQAYYQIEYRQHVLWAYNLEHVKILYDYLYLTKRTEREHPYLKHLPKIFLKKNARGYLCKKLAQYLKQDSCFNIKI